MAEVKNKPNTEEAAVLTENEINEQMQVRIDKMHKIEAVSYTHVTLPTKRIV